MFKPRECKTNETEITEKLLTLNLELPSTIGSKEEFFGFNDLVEILEKENSSLSELLDYEQKIRKIKLEEDKLNLSRDIDEEENVIASCNDYLANKSFLKDEAVDNAQEMLLKLEVLQKRLCTLLKKFAHKNFPVVEEKSNTQNKNAPSSCKLKSVLSILKLLLPELRSTSINSDSEQHVLKIDETFSKEAIEILFSANIIEKCSDNPNYVKLTD